MKLALIGYGKMGKAIEEIAKHKGHEIVLRIDSTNANELTVENLQLADVAIEFTNPHSAVQNLRRCFEAKVPVVCGSTGWLEHLKDVEADCNSSASALLYASNFSVGVNLFFQVNSFVARIMAQRTDYDVTLEEIHHTQKKDAPSGTAITLAEEIINHVKNKNSWINDTSANNDELQIISKRIDPAPGTHKVLYKSDVDEIEITHTAHSRKGFASGAVLAAEFLKNKTGIYSMKDVLGS